MPSPSPGAAPAAGASGAAPLLYVHPRGHLNDLVVPSGALSALNAAPFPKLGRYAFEVTDAELRAARVVAMDLHWALGLAGLEPLLARVREVNPAARTVVGGITAGHYPRELVEALGVDYVIQGDAEETFPALVAALIEGREPGDLPNLWSRGRSPRLARIGQAAFDASDCLTADWFPTLTRVRDWTTAAYPMSATLPVARGCALRCPTCYGSHAETFGPGLLVRSADGLARELGRVRRLGLRSLRLFAGKLPAGTLSTLLAAAAEVGPLALDRGVGIYLCTPPSEADLDALETAFDAHVGITVIPPGEHVPRPPPAALAREEACWRAAAARVRRSPRLRLDAWTMDPADAAAARGLLEPDGQRVVVSQGTGWSVTRPVGQDRPTLEALRTALAPLWTFYAARLLSPALDVLLAPFRLLDELDADPADAPAPEGPLAAWHEVAQRGWRAHRIPALTGLTFFALPAAARPGAAGVGRVGLARVHGQARRLGAAEAALRAGIVQPLRCSADAGAIRLRAALAGWPPGDAVALVPGPPTGPLSPAWLEAVATHGLLVLEGAPGAAELAISLRVQEAELAILGRGGEPLRRARAELGYVRAT